MKVIAVLLSIFFVSAIATATLGEPATSIPSDQSKLKAALKPSLSADQYTVHEMLADGNTIREFANSDGVVFAVSWRGLAKPNLEILFGTYFNEYKAAVEGATKQHGKRSAALETSRMVVKRGGRMRDQRGFAYVPSLVPNGISLEDLQK